MKDEVETCSTAEKQGSAHEGEKRIEKFIKRQYKAGLSSTLEKKNLMAVGTVLLLELCHKETVRYMLNTKDKP